MFVKIKITRIFLSILTVHQIIKESLDKKIIFLKLKYQTALNDYQQNFFFFKIVNLNKQSLLSTPNNLIIKICTKNNTILKQRQFIKDDRTELSEDALKQSKISEY